MECAFHPQLDKYCNGYSILMDSQHGFRKHHFTKTCHLAMLGQMYKKKFGLGCSVECWCLIVKIYLTLLTITSWFESWHL